MSQTTSLNPSTTSLSGIPATTPSTFTTDTSTNGQLTSVGAILTETDTTVTAFQVPGTTGLLVVDGTTLTWRQAGITLADGDVISAGFDGLQDQTTTALLSPIVFTRTTRGSPGSSSYTIQTINPTSSVTLLHGTQMSTSRTTGGSTSTGSSSGSGGGSTAASASATAASASSTGMAPTLSAGKAAALLGALGGLVVLAL